jgi:hypothetical protein
VLGRSYTGDKKARIKGLQQLKAMPLVETLGTG